MRTQPDEIALPSRPDDLQSITLVLNRVQGPNPGDGGREDYDILDAADRLVGRIYLIDSCDGVERWFWGVELKTSRRKSHGRAESFDEAKAAFKAEFERWLEEQAQPSFGERHMPSILAAPERTIDFAERTRRYRSKAEGLAELACSDGAQESYLALADSYDKMSESMEVLTELRSAR